MKNNKQKIVPLVFDTYLAVIKNSVGSKLFSNFYAKVNGKKNDIMEDGKLSCAFHVSSILALFKLIQRIHGTVDSAIRDLEELGWKKIDKPKIGSILIWEQKSFKDGGSHKHIGFFIGNKRAISNDYKRGRPIEHSWDFGGKRKIDMIFWNPRLK